MKLTTSISIFILLIAFGCTESNHKTSKKASVHFQSYGLSKPVALHFFENEYHLFYKYEEKDSIEGLGHLISEDLVSWKETAPIAEFQPSKNFKSACVVRDWNNISGLGNKSEALLAYYLKDDLLSVSFSNDFGKTWNVWNENLSLDASFLGVNDLKVVWNDDAQLWIMVLVKNYEVEFYASNDLLNWGFQSIFDTEPAVKKGNWTTVEFFPIEYSETSEIKWCLAISTSEGAANGGLGTQYFVGDFNNFQFQTEDNVKWMDNGTDYHSPVVLSDYLFLNKTPISIAKIDKSQTLNLPRTLILTRKFNEYFITSSVIPGINHNQKQLAKQEFTGELIIKQKQELPMKIDLNFDLNNRKYLDFAEVFGLILENEKQEKLIVGYHNLRRYFFISYNNEIVYAPCIIDNPDVDMKLIIDESSVELFAMNGFISMTKEFTSETTLNQLKLFTEGGKITLKEGTVYQLSSIN